MSGSAGKTAQTTLGVWFNAETGHIHLSIPGQGLSTINPDPGSKRGHPHLYNKLAKLLRDDGMPHPGNIVEDWDYGRGSFQTK